MGPVAGYRLPVAGYRLPVAGYRLPVSGFRLPVTSCRLPVSRLQPPREEKAFQVSSSRFRVSGRRLPVACFRFPSPVSGCQKNSLQTLTSLKFQPRQLVTGNRELPFLLFNKKNIETFRCIYLSLSCYLKGGRYGQ
jgi:hypothetical protein